MKLLYSPASPFARKVRVVIHETGQTDSVEVVELAVRADQANPTLIAQNPLGKIPTLITDDGTALFDSRVITRYLDAQAGAGLYPEPGWEALTLEALADGIMDAALLMVYERRLRPAEIVFEDWIGWQWEKVTRGLDALEVDWTVYLNTGLTAGHVATGCALGYLDFRHGARNWREGRPALAGWYEGFAARPSMAETVPIG